MLIFLSCIFGAIVLYDTLLRNSGEELEGEKNGDVESRGSRRCHDMSCESASSIEMVETAKDPSLEAFSVSHDAPEMDPGEKSEDDTSTDESQPDEHPTASPQVFQVGERVETVCDLEDLSPRWEEGEVM